MASYYKKYIKNYSQIAAPLIALTKQDRDLIWTPPCDKAFSQI